MERHPSCWSYEQLLESTPFGPLWYDVLPVLCRAFATVMGVYAPALRAQVEGLGARHPLASIYMMSTLDIVDLTTAKQKPANVGNNCTYNNLHCK